MINKLLTLILAIVLNSVMISAQDVIEGRVVEHISKEPQVGAIITVSTSDGTKLLGYGTSDGEGWFSIKGKDQFPSTVRLDVRGISIKNIQIQYSKSSGPLTIEVEIESMDLKEARISVSKITHRGDTLSYDVDSYRRQTDHNIGEVISRLPGITVSSSGQIIYQGKEISKFYIEGMDLLQGRYGLATNNIDARKIAEVQVLENHQPIKVLKGVSSPDAAAINLKLKKSALGAFFLTGQIGAGVAFPLFSNDITGMRFTRKQQNLLLLKQDNTGRNIADEVLSFYNEPTSPSPSFFPMLTASAPSIGRQRSLFNDSYLASVNDLHTLSNGGSVTTNINYLKDKHESYSRRTRDLFLGDGLDPLHFDEANGVENKEWQINGIITYEKNTDDRYVNNRAQFYTKTTDSDQFSTSDDGSYAQCLHVSELSLEDNLRSIWKVGTKRFDLVGNARVISQSNVLKLPDSLPSFGFNEVGLEQSLDFRNIKSDVSISRSVGLASRVEVGYKVGAFIDATGIESGISSNGERFTADSLVNDLSRSEYGLSGSGSLTYMGDKLKVIFNSPIHFTYVDVSGLHAQSRRFYPEFYPNLSASYKLNYSWTVNFNSNYSQTHGSASDAMGGYIIRSYRDFIRYNNISGKTNRLYSYVNCAFKDAYGSLFGSVSCYGSVSRKDMISSVYYDGVFARLTTIDYQNSTYDYTGNGKIGFSLKRIGADVSTSLQYNERMGEVLNQGQLSKYDTQRITLQSRVNGMIGRKIVYDYDISLSNLNNIVGTTSTSNMLNVTQNGKLSCLISKSCFMSAKVSHYSSTHDVLGKTSSMFCDLAFQYKTKSVEYMIDWTNMFSSGVYTQHLVTSAETVQSIVNIRPSELLFRIRFNLK